MSRTPGSRRIPWRLFRHEAAARTPVPAWAFVALFQISLVLAHLCLSTFGAVAVWPANGVLVAGLLLLDRRRAVAVLAACFALNLSFDVLVRSIDLQASLIFSSLNAAEAFAIALVARRFCGAALRMRRPVRLARFALLAAAPAVVLAAVIGLTLLGIPTLDLDMYLASWVSVELVGCLVVTPSMVILAQARRPSSTWNLRPSPEMGLGLAACVFTALVCLRILQLPVAAVLPVLLVVSLRLSPKQAAVMVLAVSSILTLSFLNEPSSFEAFGFGRPEADLQGGLDITTRLPSFYVYLASVLAVILPASTVVSEKSRLQARLQQRAERIREDAKRLRVAARLANEATEAKRRFLNMISHELRTPLGQVAGFTALVASDPGLSDESRDRVAKISMANTHALELVGDVIDFARGDLTVEVGAFDLRETVVTVLDHVRNHVLQHPLEVVFVNRLGDDGFFEGDARRIRRVLRLLLHNAAKFTPEGTIGVEAEVDERGARLVVFDTGVGIAADRLPRLLEVFTQGDSSITRSQEGMGIGLSLADKMVQALGGTWSIDSEIGRGTRITLNLPMARARIAEEPEDQARAPRLLIVDDHPANREILGLMARAMGCETDYASDGIEAVDAARVSAFDLILMDLRMPHMDGFEASRQIRSFAGAAAQIPILAVSAESRDESVGACRDAGIDGFLAKPVTQARLLETLSLWLDPVAADQARSDPTASMTRAA
jgi:signal transduction histidine kinase/FixJ family two-component response regulator